MSDAGAFRLASTITWILAAIFFALTVFLAIVMPIHAADALTFGEWSRLIGEDWNFHDPAVTPQEYGRPLFYVLQGWLWALVGFGEPSGRILSGLFSVLLLAALVWLVRGRRWGVAAGGLVALFLLATPSYAGHVISGLTDIPVAALVAVAGALLWRVPAGRVRTVGVTVAACLAMLAKPSALPALLGLGLAQLLFAEPWRDRLLFRIGPLASGLGIALAYDAVQADNADQGLAEFLRAGVDTAYYRELAADARRFVLLDAGWLGGALRVVVVFALVYAAARIVGARHRIAAAVGVPAALLWSWLGPWLATRESEVTVGSLASVTDGLTALAAATLLAFALLEQDGAPTRLELGRLAVWAAPTFATWALYGAYDLRLLAPAWPPLLVLVALASLPAAVALGRRGAVAAAIPFAVLAVAVANNIENLDGLGEAGWGEVRRTPASEWLDRDTMRATVLPAFSRALIVTRRETDDDDRVFSSEGAFRFFYPGRTEQSFPVQCSDLEGYRVFVMSTDQGSRDYMERFLHVSGDPAWWGRCERPRLTQLTDASEGYAVFRVES
jgi:hypothetical protein